RRERADVYLELDRPQDALADLATILEARPDDVFALAARAQAFVLVDELDDAIVDLDRAIGLVPQLGYLFRLRGEAPLLRLDDAGALDDLERAVELGPEPEAQLLLGESLLLAGRPEDALAPIEAAFGAVPENDWVRYLRGLAETVLERRDAAARDFDDAIA